MPGNEALDTFQTTQLESLSEAELSALIQTASVYDEIPYLARASKYFDKYGDELRSNVRDGFQKYFEQALEKMAGSGWTAVSIQQVKKLEDFIRKKITRKGLDVICKKLSVTDLDLLRGVLKTETVGYSKNDVEFLRVYGEWSDIPLIISSLTRVNYGSAFLFLSEVSHYREAAQAISKIGKTRLAELLEMEAPAELIYRLALVSAIKDFRELDDDLIQRLLISENDSLRKAISLKCVISLPKKRLEDILNRYSEGENFRYYNVIYWLDFGISLPRDRSNSAAKKSIQRMSQ
jgi:DNA-binding Xre family transcriptional regulator